jgi:hypothetical protein
MERAVYFDGWYPNQYCYHPSMPPRRLSMLEDLADVEATMLVWAGLGGGSISLPYLEEEAYGHIPPRFRQHGYVNDSEFIAHARDRGIDLFAIVFEAQAWEFGAELDEAGGVLAQNELRGAGVRQEVGLREFGAGTGPADWKPLLSYFPDGLRNSLGEEVTDLWNEVASRSLDGEPLHAHWVEVAHGDQRCHFADRNNPVWLEYLKQVVRIQIDAGARAIQLDETDSPMTAFRYGGCFCKDCMAVLRRYLATLPAAALPAELADVDLETFDYRQYLLAAGYRTGMNPQAFPLYEQYARSQQLAIADTFAELVRAAREHAASKGVPLRIAGNFYDCAPYYDPLVEHVDVLVTEMRETRYRQPWYFKHGVGLARGRALVAVENPYGGLIPDLHRSLQAGRSYDRFRLTIYEASGMGANMALPYGSWLGTDIRDAYWAPRDLALECGQFLKEIDHLIDARTTARTAVVYSVRSMMRATLDSDQFSDEGRWFEPLPGAGQQSPPYWDVLKALTENSVTYDVVVFPDQELRADDITDGSVAGYTTIIVADMWGLNASQHQVLVRFAAAGGKVLVHGRYGTELPAPEVAQLLNLPSAQQLTDIHDLAVRADTEVLSRLGPLIAVNVSAVADGVAVHLLNYDFDEAADAIRVRSDMSLEVRSALAPASAVLHRPGCAPVSVEISWQPEGVCTVRIPELATYGVVHLTTKAAE